MKGFKAYVAEAFGTFVLVFFACGVAALTNGSLVPTALSFGLVIVAMAYTIGPVSGCHINPAVSLGCLLTKRMSLKDFFGYVVAQIIGGLLGGMLLFAICKMAGMSFVSEGGWLGDACNGLVHVTGDKATFGNYAAAILVEVVLTCVFVYVILNVTSAKNESVGKKAGLIIGLTLTLVHLLGIGLTGTSVNPARAIGTAVAALIFGDGTKPLIVLWVFVVAPLLGGALAALTYKIFREKE